MSGGGSGLDGCSSGLRDGDLLDVTMVSSDHTEPSSYDVSLVELSVSMRPGVVSVVADAEGDRSLSRESMRNVEWSVVVGVEDVWSVVGIECVGLDGAAGPGWSTGGVVGVWDAVGVLMGKKFRMSLWSRDVIVLWSRRLLVWRLVALATQAASVAVGSRRVVSSG